MVADKKMADNGDKIVQILKDNELGLTITDLVDKIKLSRATIRTMLARLEGAGKIKFRKVGMAKIYTIK